MVCIPLCGFHTAPFLFTTGAKRDGCNL